MTDPLSLASEPAEVAIPARPPTVLQVLPRLVSGGVERGTVDLARALAAAGGTALVASEGGPMVAELSRAGAQHYSLGLATKSPFGIRRNAGKLEQIIAARGVGIIHARSRAPAWSALMASRRAGIPLVTTFHAAYGIGEGGLSGLIAPLKRRYNAVMLAGARVIAISEFIARHIAETYAPEGGRVRVIPRGIDTARFDPDAVSAARIAQLADAWRLPDDAAVLLLPARLSRIKGHGVLLEALAKLARPDLRCVFLGANPKRRGYIDELDATVRRLGLTAQVQFVTDCNDMPAAYMLATAVIAPSIVPEGFGRVPVEAMAMGRPVIASDLGAFPETLADGQYGWLTRAGDAAALADALRQVLSLDAEARANIGLAARVHVLECYTLRRMVAATMALYRDLIEAA